MLFEYIYIYIFLLLLSSNSMNHKKYNYYIIILLLYNYLKNPISFEEIKILISISSVSRINFSYANDHPSE